MNIPPLDLSLQYQSIESEISSTVLEVLASGRYIGGPVVLNFESDLAQYHKTPYAVTCNSGTDALFLSLRALDIGLGDEVITTPFTFIATAEVISRVGALPVFVDVDPLTLNIDPNQIEAAITKRTKAIIPVHLFGQPANMTVIMELAESYNLKVIEDCAQATGACWDNKKVGSIGTIGCFSFFPTKNLGGFGDGGAIITHDKAIAQRIRQLKEHGSPERYYHDETGINSRLDAIQAAILQVKLRHLDNWNDRRCQKADHYRELLKYVSQIILPQELPLGRGVWNQFTIRIKHKELNYRNQIREKLLEKGVVSMIYYPIPLHYQPVYKYLGYQPGQLPNAEQAAEQVLSLPMSPEITTEEQEYVVYQLKDCLS